MPQAIAGALVSWFGSAAFGWGAAYTIAYTVVIAGSAEYSKSQKRKAEARARAAANASAKDRELMIRSAVAPRRVIYGRDKVSGPLVYAQSTGDKQQYLHLVIALAAHECDVVEAIYFNDILLPALDVDGFVTSGEFVSGDTTDMDVHTGTTDGAGAITLPNAAESIERAFTLTGAGDANFETHHTGFSHTPGSASITGLPASETVTISYTKIIAGQPKARIKVHLGGSGQTADADLVSESGGLWTSDHIGAGICYLYVRLEYDQDIFGAIGVPNISAVVRGKKVYDPRTALTAWSNNAALCCADHLQSDEGLRADSAEVPSSEVIAAANICDEVIDLDLGGTETQLRYTCDYSFTTDTSPREVLTDMLAGMAGRAVWTQGRWLLRAGAYRTPTVTITADMLAGPITVAARASRSDLFNAVRVTHRDPEGAYAEVQSPLVKNSGYEAEDGGVRIVRQIEVPVLADTWRAQRLGKIELERARQALTVKLTTNLAAYDLSPTDSVMLTLPWYGWSAKVFEVLERTLSREGLLQYTLRETAAGVWDWAYGEATIGDLAPNSDLPSPYARPAALTGLAITEATRMLSDGSLVLQAVLSWDESENAFVRGGGRIEIQWARANLEAVSSISQAGDTTEATLMPLIGGIAYIVRARQVTAVGRAGDWAYISWVAQNDSEPPDDVANLAYAVKPYQVVLSWDRCVALDYAETELRVGASWAAGTMLWRGKANEYKHPRPDNGTYEVWACHIDTSGNYSAAPQSISVTVDDSIDAGGSALLWLQTSSFPAFVFDSVSDTTSDSPTITFTARLIGMTGTASWVAEAFDITDTSLGTLTLGGTGNVRTMDATLFNSLGDTETRYVDVTASRTIGSTTYSDTVRVYRADAASTLAQLYLENPYAVVPADAAGANEDFTNAETLVDVYVGTTGDTGAWSIAISADPGITATIDGGAGPVSGVWSPVVAITAMSVDVGAVEITATKGSDVLTRYFRAVKVRAGGSAYMHYLDPLQSIVLPVDLNGTVTSYAAAHTNAVAKQGTTDDTSNWTITKTDRNVTSTLVGGLVSITSILEPGTLTSTGSTANVKPTGYTAPNDWTFVGNLLFNGTTWVLPGRPGSGGSNGHVMTSTDFLTWTQRDMSLADGYWSIGAVAGGTFVVLGGPTTSRAAVSTDGGVTWTEETMPASAQWTCAAGGNGYIMVSRNGSTTGYRSATGLTGSWTTLTLPGTTCLLYYIAPNRWAALSGSGSVYTSTDNGATWSSARNSAMNLPGGASVRMLFGYRGLIVALINGTTTSIWVSADMGATWTIVIAPTSIQNARMFWCVRDVLYLAEHTGKLLWTADGYRWRYSSTTLTGPPDDTTFLGNLSGQDLQIDYLPYATSLTTYKANLAATADGAGYVRLHFAKGAETLPDLTLPVSKGNIVSTVYSVSAYPAAVQLPATSDGVVTDYAAGTVTARADKAGSDDTANWLWTWVASAGITPASGSSNVATITAMSSAVDTGSITFTATKAGETARYGTIPVSKLKGSEPSGIRQGAAFTPFSASDTYIALRFKGTGEYQIKNGSGGSWVTAGQWVIPLGASNATTYWLKVDTSGHALDGASSATGTWLAMTSDRDYILSDAASGTHYTSLEVYFATSSGGAGAVRNIGELRLQVP